MAITLAAADNLALARIGDAGFDAIAVIRLVLGNRGGKVDGELAFGIELAFALHDLLVAVVVALGVAGVGRRIFIGLVPQRKPVAAAIDGVLQLGAGHGLAEVVAGIDHRLRRLALQDARLRGVTRTSYSGFLYSSTSKLPFMKLSSPA